MIERLDIPNLQGKNKDKLFEKINEIIDWIKHHELECECFVPKSQPDVYFDIHDKCKNCHTIYGRHYGMECPKGESYFEKLEVKHEK